MSGNFNFFSQLKDKRSINLVNELHKFINISFGELCEKLEDISDIALAVQDFVTQMINDFGKTWNIDFRESQNYYIQICEGFESLITKSLYSQIINYMQEDNRLDRLIKKYSFLTLTHLGIDLAIDEFELAAQIKNFKELIQFRSPKEKLNVITNFFNYLISKYKITEKSLLVRLIVFTIIKMNLPNLKTQLKFIGIFRHKTIISSDEDYYLSIIFCSIELIEKMNAAHLKISKSRIWRTL